MYVHLHILFQKDELETLAHIWRSICQGMPLDLFETPLMNPQKGASKAPKVYRAPSSAIEAIRKPCNKG